MELTNSGAGVSLPAIWLWMLLQGLLVAGRDARPTIVNISPYLKTPIWARLPNITGSNFSDHPQQKLIFQDLTLLLFSYKFAILAVWPKEIKS